METLDLSKCVNDKDGTVPTCR